MSNEAELLKLLDQLERRRRFYRLDYYKPYPFQLSFHNSKGHGTDKPAAQRVLLAGNGTGKTICGAMESAFHLTGRYPAWWKGHRFTKQIVAMIGGMTNEAVRDISQKHLFGDPAEKEQLGSGSIPIDAIGKITSKPGVPNAYDTALVKHASGGWSKAMFRAYEQGKDKHMGHRIDMGWLDEEPQQDIWSQYLRATISMNGILFITFTPEKGLTQVVNNFMNDLQVGQALIPAAWQDAPHLMKDGNLTDEAKQLLAGFPPHEREMRMRGTPTYGTGLVFPFAQEQLEVEPMPIPRHWPQIIGIDFGSDHPFAAARLAWDRDNDVVYVTAEYRESRAIPSTHVAAIKPWGSWIPVSWPHDGLNTEKSTGDELRKSYADLGLNMLNARATNPPDPAQGQKEGQGGNSVEKSIQDMYVRMETGRWKVFSTCRNWFQEMRTYHRDEQGKLVKLRDDLISASRCASMMLRHSRTESVKTRKIEYQIGATNW